MTSSSIALYIDPPSPHFLGDRLFDSGTAATGGDDLMAPWRAVREHFVAAGVPVHTADLLPDGDPRVKKVYVSTGLVSDYERLSRRDDVILSAHFAMECPIVEPSLYSALPHAQRYFRRIMSWTDGASLQHFTGALVETQGFRWPQSFDTVHEALWSRRDRGFLVMINANKLPRVYWNELYTQRLRAVEYFHQHGEVDLYGPNWDRRPSRVGKSWVPMAFRRLYRLSGLEDAVWGTRQRVAPNPLYAAAKGANRGIAKSKSETLSRYTFALCFENMLIQGWMTEKMFDCLFTGTVPIYWGATDVERWVPSECYIDMRRFTDFGELRRFLHALSPTEVERYREAARDYLASSAYDPFRKQTFVDLFRRLVREDTGVVV